MWGFAKAEASDSTSQWASENRFYFDDEKFTSGWGEKTKLRFQP